MIQKFRKNMLKLILVFLFLVFGLFYIFKLGFGFKYQQNVAQNVEKNVCTGYLTDYEYLEHMIPHHQVAVDISVLLQKQTKNPEMQEILRKLIWVQKYEIQLMEDMKHQLPIQDMSVENNMRKKYVSTTGDFIKPNTLGLTHTYCDPHFFDPEKHMEHMKHMKLNDEMYVKHMIPHHQVAVDMSKVLLKNTTNDFMIYLGYRIIRSQQDEIVLLNNFLSKKRYVHQSVLL
tara:strand:+ start:855 stop:1544 length:690 start_codon:yes stop_codon:yes gene_type:complete